MSTHVVSARSAVKNNLVVSASIIVVVLLLSLFGIKMLTIAASLAALVAVLVFSGMQKCKVGEFYFRPNSIALTGLQSHDTEPDHIDPCKS